MKIAVFSDVHGNLPALRAAMLDAEDRKADIRVFLGDFITDFPFTREIMDIVKSQGDIVVRGNRESYMLNRANGGANDWEHHDHLATNLMTYNALTADDIEYLRGLPLSVTLELSTDISVIFCHGSPESEYKALREREPEIARLALEKITQSHLVCGHCHKNFVLHHNGKTLINAGSVGINYNCDPSATYALISYQDNQLDCQFIRAKYDLNELKQACDPSVLWQTMLIKTLVTGINYNILVLDECGKRKSGWPIPNDIYHQVYNEIMD